jgi:glycerophosphoryl diester phosphodiesterase
MVQNPITTVIWTRQNDRMTQTKPPSSTPICSHFDSAIRRFREGWVAISLLMLATGACAFDLQGHRGARGLAPENTIPAFERALEIGVTTLELDIGVTADNVVVIAHDPYLNPAFTRDASGQWLKVATPGKGPTLRSLTLQQLQAYDVGRIHPDVPYAKTFSTQQPVDGTRVPTLAALFARVKGLDAGHIRFNIETKINPGLPDDTVGPEAMVNALLTVVREAGMVPRVTIQSFDWRTLQLVQKLEPRIPTVYLTIQTANTDNLKDGTWTAGFKLADHGSVPKMVKAAGGAVWSPNGGAVTEPLVKEAQALGLKVIPWTVNAPAELDKFMAWGVDGLISDYPDRLREAVQKRGLPLPAIVKLVR